MHAETGELNRETSLQTFRRVHDLRRYAHYIRHGTAIVVLVAFAGRMPYMLRIQIPAQIILTVTFLLKISIKQDVI